jgi:hypothetical protein
MQMIDTTTVSQYVSYVVGPGTVVSVIFLVLRGKLIPRKTFESVKESQEERVATYRDLSNKWENAYGKERDARVHQEAALNECLELSRTAVKALDDIRQAGKHD